jgi:hypothetical protein
MILARPGAAERRHRSYNSSGSPSGSAKNVNLLPVHWSIRTGSTTTPLLGQLQELGGRSHMQSVGIDDLDPAAAHNGFLHRHLSARARMMAVPRKTRQTDPLWTGPPCGASLILPTSGVPEPGLDREMSPVVGTQRTTCR